jgi:hypothetical protein
MWTFETQWNAAKGTWYRSGQRFKTAKEAADAAARWMLVNAENGSFLAVRLAKL